MPPLLNHPVPFVEALEFLFNRAVLPTHLGTRELRQLEADVRRKSFFSARNTLAEALDFQREQVAALLQGEFNEATARAKVQDLYDSIDYRPAPDDEGGLKDLSSDKRIRLVLETNLRQAANFGLLEQGNDPLSRWQYPAFELVRIYDREEPRGEMPGSLGWLERFVRAGGRLFDGRMIARKDDPVWASLGDSNLFEDGLDSPFPPFAFNSGMGWREVPREEAIELGLITGDEAPSESDARFFDEEMAEDAAQFNPQQFEDLRRSLRARIRELNAA